MGIGYGVGRRRAFSEGSDVMDDDVLVKRVTVAMVARWLLPLFSVVACLFPE